jgi:hypothetical protein
MRIKQKKFFVHLLVAAAAIIAIAHGCARYAPVPPTATLRTMLDITLITKQNITSDFYYYIALDATGSTTSDGPHENLSGADRAKNWSYYIVCKNGEFNELLLTRPQDADLVPTPFDASSTRYYSATASGNTINIVMYLDTIAPTTRNVWFNFITSRYEINNQEQENIIPVDYLTPPYFKMATNRYPWQESSSTQSQVSAYTPAADANKPGDIYLWIAKIYQR